MAVDFGQPHPGEPAYRRPALVLGPPENFGPGSPFVILAPLTTAHRGLSLHVGVEASDAAGPDETSYVQCELIRSVSAKRLVHRLGTISTDESLQVASIMRTLLNH